MMMNLTLTGVESTHHGPAPFFDNLGERREHRHALSAELPLEVLSREVGRFD